MVGHVTRVQDGRLVVEVHLDDAPQVVAHDGDGVAHVGARDQGVGGRQVRRADVVDDRFSIRDLVAVRLVHASGDDKPGQERREGKEPEEICLCIHSGI